MPTQHVVVDGSNIATESRQLPSLAQLESALEELRKDFPDNEVTVVVDATFAHRIDPSELARYEEAALRGELVSPPAGAIGRGDAFLLRIAEKVDGTVLSNDSFQEFHGEHPWLFERGRLIGATPVPGVGWIFVPRTPVRGPKSRVATRDANRAKERVTVAIAAATREAEDPEATDAATEPKARRSRSRRPAVTPLAVNDPMTFISFIAEHKLGDEIEADVESFTSHGAVIFYGDVRCYAPLANLGQPPPRSAREVLKRAEHRSFVITALDPYRRGIELAMPGVAVVSGRPSEETVEAEVRLSRRSRRGAPSAGEAPPKIGDSRPAGSLVALPQTSSAATAAAGGPEVEATPAEAVAAAPRRRARTAKAVAPASTTPASTTPSERSSTGRGRRKAAPPGSEDSVGQAAPPQEPPTTARARKAPATSKLSAIAPTPAAKKASAAKVATPARASATKAPAKRAAKKAGGTAKAVAVEAGAVAPARKARAPRAGATVDQTSVRAEPRRAPAKVAAKKATKAVRAKLPAGQGKAASSVVASPAKRASRRSAK